MVVIVSEGSQARHSTPNCLVVNKSGVTDVDVQYLTLSEYNENELTYYEHRKKDLKKIVTTFFNY